MRYRNVINARLATARNDPRYATEAPYAVGDIVRLCTRGYLRIEQLDPLDPGIVHGYLAESGYAGCFASVALHEISEHVACEWPRRRIPIPHDPTPSVH